jgi:hypothetical protein
LISVDQLLFNSGYLRDALAAQTQAMFTEIASVAEDDLLAVDEIEWAQALVVRYKLDLPEIQPGDAWFEDPRPARLDLSWDVSLPPRPGGGPIIVDGYRSVLHVPYTGYRAAFSLQPGEHTYNPPVGGVINGDLVQEVTYRAGSSPNWQGIKDEFIRTVELWVGFARNDMESVNAGLLNEAQMTIRNRRQLIEHNRAQMQASGVRFGQPRDPDKTYIQDVIRRRPSPHMPAREDQAIPFERLLDKETFEHILNVIRLTTASFEQTPRTYADMGEQDLRQVIRAALNTHYEGAANAEAPTRLPADRRRSRSVPRPQPAQTQHSVRPKGILPITPTPPERLRPRCVGGARTVRQLGRGSAAR